MATSPGDHREPPIGDLLRVAHLQPSEQGPPWPQEAVLPVPAGLASHTERKAQCPKARDDRGLHVLAQRRALDW